MSSGPRPSIMRTITVIIISVLFGLFLTVSLVGPGIYSRNCDASMPYGDGGSVTWSCPVFDEYGFVSGHADVMTPTGITEDDFKAAFRDRSMPRSCMFDCGFIVPDCPGGIIENISASVRACGGDMDSYTDREKCITIQSFITTGIGYRHDEDLYGCPDYAATPTETLYLRMGDCEDVSILFVSIARAFGIDSTLMILDEHCMAGVRIEGYEDDADGYSALECTSQFKIWGLRTGAEKEIRHVVTDGLPDSAATAWMRYSNAISDYNPILFILRMFS